MRCSCKEVTADTSKAERNRQDGLACAASPHLAAGLASCGDVEALRQKTQTVQLSGTLISLPIVSRNEGTLATISEALPSIRKSERRGMIIDRQRPALRQGTAYCGGPSARQ